MAVDNRKPSKKQAPTLRSSKAGLTSGAAPAGYGELLADLKTRIRAALRATMRALSKSEKSLAAFFS